MMYRLVLLFCVLFCSYSSYGWHPSGKAQKGLSQELDSVVDYYKKNFSNDVKNRKLTQDFKKYATQSELVQLCEHSSKVIRFTAFSTLISKFPEFDVYPILLDHLSDKTTYQENSGPFGKSQKHWLIDDFLNAYDFSLPENQIGKIDSIIIAKRMKLAYRDYVLERWQPEHGYYKKLKKIYKKEKDGLALVAMAKFQEEEVVDIVLKDWSKLKRSDRYKVVRAFPHSKFFPIIEKDLNAHLFEPIIDGSKELYYAIVAYNNKMSGTLLVQAIKRGEKLDRKEILEVIAESPKENLEEAMWLLWEGYGLFKKVNAAYLVVKDKSRAELAFANSIRFVLDRFSKGENIMYEEHELAGIMGLFLESKYLTTAIGQILHKGPVELILAVARFLKQNHYSDWVPILINRIKSGSSEFKTQIKPLVKNYFNLKEQKIIKGLFD